MNNNDQLTKANEIIKSHVMLAMGAGAVPIPLMDILAVSGVQMDMIKQLANVYGRDFKENQSKAIISALASSGLSRLMAARVVKFIPGIGSLLGGVAMASLSGASTYALGQVFRMHFETGGTVLDFDTNKLKSMYDDLFEKGKTFAEDLKKQHNIPDDPIEINVKDNKETSSAKVDIVSQLKELADLKDKGVITQQEFDDLKSRLMKSMS